MTEINESDLSDEDILNRRLKGGMIFPKRFSPKVANIHEAIQAVFSNSIIGSYAPLRPPLPESASVASIGSCFAQELSKSLEDVGVNVSHVFMNENWNSAFALMHFLERTALGKPFPEGFLADQSVVNGVDLDLRPEFAKADLFVLTFGLSLCWFLPGTKQVVLEPEVFSFEAKKNVKKKYEMRQTTVEENETAVLACIKLVKDLNPNALVVVTLSPVPLLAAVTDYPVIPANAMSKAVLKVALQNIVDRKLPNVFYWPSYEFVTWYGAHVSRVFGTNDDNMRHVDLQVVKAITTFFKHYFFFKGTPKGK